MMEGDEKQKKRGKGEKMRVELILNREKPSSSSVCLFPILVLFQRRIWLAVPEKKNKGREDCSKKKRGAGRGRCPSLYKRVGKIRSWTELEVDQPQSLWGHSL